jgi:hypothetical protein
MVRSRYRWNEQTSLAPRNSQSPVIEITRDDDLYLQVSAALDGLPQPAHCRSPQCDDRVHRPTSGCGTRPSGDLQFDPDRGMVAALLPPPDVMIDLSVR